MATATSKVTSARLRSECRALGIPVRNQSRNDMVISLQSNGLYEIDTQFPARAPKINVLDRRDDPTNVYLGNGAGLNNNVPNQLYISNSTTERPLIRGDFGNGRIELNHILNLRSTSLDACRIGREGDIVRDGSGLYMFRSTEVQPGWYPIQFGSVLIV